MIIRGNIRRQSKCRPTELHIFIQLRWYIIFANWCQRWNKEWRMPPLLFTRSPNQWNVHWARSLCMLGKAPFALCVHNHIPIDARHFISLKPVLAFQTLTPATLGKWATTHEKHFFLGKNCSWTLLPGSTWLQTTITWVYPRSNIKTCWWLTGLSRLYDASQPPGRHARYFKTRLKILVDRALRQHAMHYFLLTLDQFTCCVSRHNNRCKQSVPRFPLVCYFPLTQKQVQLRFCGIWFWLRTPSTVCLLDRC